MRPALRFPLIALLLAATFLHELIGSRSIGGSVMAFVGVIVIVLGQARADLGTEALLGSAAIIGSALCYAINIVLMTALCAGLALIPLGAIVLAVFAAFLAAIPALNARPAQGLREL